MPTTTIGLQYKTLAHTVPLDPINYVTAGEIEDIFYVPAGSVNLEFDFVFLHLKVVCYCVAVVTQTAAQKAADTFVHATVGALAVKVNSSGSPAPDLGTIQANAPISFAPNIQGSTNLFSADVTKFFVSNPGTADLSLFVSVGLTV